MYRPSSKLDSLFNGLLIAAGAVFVIATDIGTLFSAPAPSVATTIASTAPPSVVPARLSAPRTDVVAQADASPR